MKVKDAKILINKIDNEVKNLQKFCLLSPEEREEIAEQADINSPLETMVNVSVNAMLSWKRILLDKIDNVEIDER